MSTFSNTIRGLVFKRSGHAGEVLAAGEPEVSGSQGGQGDNPYLAARRSWNDHVGGVVASRQLWQVVALLSLLIALASVGGI